MNNIYMKNKIVITKIIRIGLDGTVCIAVSKGGAIRLLENKFKISPTASLTSLQ